MEENSIKCNEIYIIHEYLEQNHFKALYDYAEKYEYSIKDFIVLHKHDILRRCLIGIFKEKKFLESISNFISELIKLIKLRFIKDKIIIVGIAPYDYLLNKYKKVFQKNKCIYFTSWQFWDGSKFPKGSIKNKKEFEKILNEYFVAGACVSNSTEVGLKKILSNTKVVNHSIDINKYDSKNDFSIKKEKKYIYLGQLIERKNINLIIDWIENNKEIECCINFAGIGPLGDRIKELSKKDYRVNYLGKLSKEEIRKTLKNYDYLILPSKEEPFGIVLIEALAAGVPCIVSDTLGPMEIIKNEYTGFIFNKNSAKDFDQIMKNTLILDKKIYKNMSNNCVIEAKKYDSSEIVKKWIEIINIIN